MEEKFKGIVLQLKDYKDADKIASIFTLEQGIISAKFTGVKREKAKLKAIAQPFVFAEFNYIQKSDFITVTNATLLDNFYPILMSYDKTICGYIILDVLKTILPYKKVEKELFLLTLNTLKNLEIQNEYLMCVDFIIKMLSFIGEGLNFSDLDYVFIDKNTGEITEIKNQYTRPIDKKIYAILKYVHKQEFDKIKLNSNNTEVKNFKTIEENNNLQFNNKEQHKSNPENVVISQQNLKQALRLLYSILSIKFGLDIKSFEML